MNKPIVYLAGPITGTSYDECMDWRVGVISTLGAKNSTGVSPLRHKEHLRDEEGVKIGDAYEDELLSSQRGVFTRDFWDVRRCDAILVNLLGAERVSIGTVMEIALAWSLNKPIVLVIEQEGNIHEHSMLREACPLRVKSLEEGVGVIEKLFR